MALPSFDRKPYKVTLTEVSVRSTSQSSSGLSERGVRRKVDLRLLPLLFWLAIVASLDVQNIGSARIEGLPKTLHLAKQEFSVAVIVFYIPTILFTIPTNLLIHATRPSLFMGVMTLLCGIVTICQGLTQSLPSLIVCRILLGLFQTGIQGGSIYLIAAYYPRYALQARMACFLACRLLANAFGGLLAYALVHMEGLAGYPAWRWLFIIEGALVAVSVTVALFVPDWPEQVRFLQSGEKETLLNSLKSELHTGNCTIFTLAREVLRDPKTYFNAVIHFCCTAISSSAVVFLPTILNELGWHTTKALYMTIPVWIVAFVVTVLNGIGSDYIKRRYPFLAGSLVAVIIAYSILLGAKHVAVGVRYMACFFLISGAFAADVSALTWLSNNVMGQKRRGVALGIVGALGNLGYLVGPNVYLDREAPWYPTGFGVCLALGVLALCSATTQLVYLIRRSRHRQSDVHKMMSPGASSPTSWTDDGFSQKYMF